MVIFGSGEYARRMRPDCKDVIDMAAASERSSNFEAIMGFVDGLQFADVVPDMVKRAFVINQPYENIVAPQGSLSPGGSHKRRCFTYCKIVIPRNERATFYAFITDIKPLNSESCVFSFMIDWWHTFFALNPDLTTLKRAYVNRRNTHVVTTDETTGLTEIYVPEALEKEVLVDEMQLESNSVYKASNVVLGDNRARGDADIKYVRLCFTEGKMPEGLSDIFYDLTQPNNNIDNGLYYVFMPIVPKSKYQGVGIHQDAYSKRVSYSTYIKGLSAAMAALSLSPTCVSIDLLPNIPFVAKTDTYTIVNTEEGVSGIGIDLIFNDNCVIKTARDNSELKDIVWLIQTEIATTSKEYTLGAYTDYKYTGWFNFTSGSCVFDEDDVTGYASNKLRNDGGYIEPKLAQPQYSKSIITDNAGAQFAIKPYQHGSNLKTLRVVQVPNGTTYKRKFWLCETDDNGVTTAYGNDVEGRRYVGMSDRVCAMPVKNNALIDYLNGNRNQMITGLAIQKMKNISQITLGAGEMLTSAVQMGGGSIGKMAGIQGTMGGLGKVVGAYMQSEYDEMTHKSQIADLEEQADTVSMSGGNNAEFEVASNSGVLTLEVWSPTERDRERLSEYFYQNGYAVGKYEEDISLDTMYYFDYIEATNIDFLPGDYSKPQNDVYNMTPECEAYIRAKFAKGVRIWHVRAPRGGANNQMGTNYQIFNTPYRNTAKEY